MTLKQFGQWASLGFVLLAIAGCSRTVKSPQATAVSPTSTNLPVPINSTVTPAEEIALDLATAVSPTPLKTLPTSPATLTPSPRIVVDTRIPTVTPKPTSTRGPIPVGIPDPHAPFIQGNYAYISDYQVFIVLDISDPTTPKVVGRFFPSYPAIISIRVAGSYAYVLRENGLQIVDISSPSNPDLVSFYSVDGSATALNIVDDRAYLTEGGFLHPLISPTHACLN